MEYAKKCDGCQTSEFLHTISAPWPFMKWRMDIVGKLPRAPCNKVFMLAMTCYFSKWIEAEAFKSITEDQVISFIKRCIICRYGIPSKIVFDNGSQFIGNKMENYCAKWGINLVK